MSSGDDDLIPAKLSDGCYPPELANCYAASQLPG
jgi:hypothetical protein